MEPVLKDTQNLTGRGLEQVDPVLVDPTLSREVGLEDLQRCLPASTIPLF